jgi:Family of unknown function (DUF6494)
LGSTLKRRGGGTNGRRQVQYFRSKFLKVVGITAQREIEKAVREVLNAGRLKGDANLKAKMTLEIGVLGLTHSVEEDVELG